MAALNRRAFIAGALSLSVVAPAVAKPPPDAEFMALFRSMSSRERQIIIGLFSALISLPEGADTEPLLAAAISALRAERAMQTQNRRALMAGAASMAIATPVSAAVFRHPVGEAEIAEAMSLFRRLSPAAQRDVLGLMRCIVRLSGAQQS